MRAAFSAAISRAIEEAQIEFPYLCGISAGSSIALNHISRDWQRSYHQFVESPEDPKFGGVAHLLAGHGFFNSNYLYEGCVSPDGVPFDWPQFCKNRAEVGISAFGACSGETYLWHKRDMPHALALMKLCRASSTLPLLMKPITINEEPVFDGGIGAYLGLSFQMALEHGYERFVMVATQPRGYRKRPFPSGIRRLLETKFAKYPKLVSALLSMSARYNDMCEQLDALEASGQALIIRPAIMPVSSTTLKKSYLATTYNLGLKQAPREIERILKFIER